MRRHKFGAVATVVDGHTFPSKAEARRYQELRLLEKAGQITKLRLRPWAQRAETIHNAAMTAGAPRVRRRT